VKISIVTVVRNRVRLLPTNIESVLSQTWPDVEYIVVDGASTDGTVELLRQVEPRFCGRMKWISEPDKGIYDAMNKGIRMATGDVVAILNSDDFYHRKDTLRRVADEFVADPELQVVYGDNVYVREPNLDKVVRYASGASYSLFTARCGMVPPHATFFSRRENFEKYGFYDPTYKLSADCELEIRFLEKFRLKRKYLPFDFMTMRLGGASSSGLKSILTMQSECLRACRANGLKTNFMFQLLRLAIKLPQKFKMRPHEGNAI